MNKPILTLTYPHVSQHSSEAYRVDQVTDSSEYVPGELLEKTTVRDLCTLGMYKIVMKRNTDNK